MISTIPDGIEIFLQLCQSETDAGRDLLECQLKPLVWSCWPLSWAYFSRPFGSGKKLLPFGHCCSKLYENNTHTFSCLNGHHLLYMLNLNLLICNRDLLQLYHVIHHTQQANSRHNSSLLRRRRLNSFHEPNWTEQQIFQLTIWDTSANWSSRIRSNSIALL